jgi:hypothetical protein
MSDNLEFDQGWLNKFCAWLAEDTAQSPESDFVVDCYKHGFEAGWSGEQQEIARLKVELDAKEDEIKRLREVAEDVRSHFHEWCDQLDDGERELYDAARAALEGDGMSLDEPDKNCVTTGDGSCVGADCMHDAEQATWEPGKGHRDLPLLVHECPSCGKLVATRSNLVPAGESGDDAEIVGWLIKVDCAECAVKNLKFKVPVPEFNVSRPDVLFAYANHVSLLVRKPKP